MSQRILQVVLALWAGSLWTISFIVAPSLFAVTPDRVLAGAIAGHFFRVESWLGLALGGIALAALSRSAAALRSRLHYALVIVSAGAPLANELLLRPFMEQARVAGDMNTFGILHGMGAALFTVACATTILLIWRVSISRPEA